MLNDRILKAGRLCRAGREASRYRFLTVGASILFAFYPMGSNPAAAAPDRIVTVLAAGDIASCDYRKVKGVRVGRVPDRGALETARILDRFKGTILALGDLAYPDGTAADFRDCYGPTWGRHKERTRPIPGNHEYNNSGTAADFYDYWQDLLGQPGRRFYSFDLGAWHIVALNSNIRRSKDSEQMAWLRADLAATQRRCILAYFHHPRFSSGGHGGYESMGDLFETLYEFGTTLLLSGHDHNYERLAPQNPSGQLDRRRGIRQFVVGTGGKGLRGHGQPEINSEAFYNASHGVLKLDLGEQDYTWRFIPTRGTSIVDTGSAPCAERTQERAAARTDRGKL